MCTPLSVALRAPPNGLPTMVHTKAVALFVNTRTWAIMHVTSRTRLLGRLWRSTQLPSGPLASSECTWQATVGYFLHKSNEHSYFVECFSFRLLERFVLFQREVWRWCKVLLLLAPEIWDPQSNSNCDRHAAATSVKGNAQHFGSLMRFFLNPVP